MTRPATGTRLDLETLTVSSRKLRDEPRTTTPPSTSTGRFIQSLERGLIWRCRERGAVHVDVRAVVHHALHHAKRDAAGFDPTAHVHVVGPEPQAAEVRKIGPQVRGERRVMHDVGPLGNAGVDRSHCEGEATGEVLRGRLPGQRNTASGCNVDVHGSHGDGADGLQIKSARDARVPLEARRVEPDLTHVGGDEILEVNCPELIVRVGP
jgi:hypothetical protein